jgi:hypothetical protein
MALQFNIESLEGVDASLHALYTKTDSGYRLDVSGVDTADELKGALAKERESNKEAKRKLAEIEAAREDAERKTLEEQGKFKDLSEKERIAKLEAEKRFTELQRKVSEKTRDIMLRDLAQSMTADVVEQESIILAAERMVKIEGEEVSFSKPIEELKTDLTRFVRSKAQGDNDGGNNRGGVNKDIDISKLTPAQMMRIGREQKK